MSVPFLTPNEVAESLNVTPERIRMLCRDGIIGYEWNGEYFIHPGQLEAYLKAREQNPSKPGRKRNLEHDRMIRALHDQGYNALQIHRKTKLARTTVSDYVRIYREEKEAARLAEVLAGEGASLDERPQQ